METFNLYNHSCWLVGSSVVWHLFKNKTCLGMRQYLVFGGNISLFSDRAACENINLTEFS